jgi:hypothetical protein
LHNRASNNKTNDSLSPIIENIDQLNLEFNSNNNLDIEDLGNELEFTSDYSELTQYDVNSIADPNELEYQSKIESTDKPNLNAMVCLKRINLKNYESESSNVAKYIIDSANNDSIGKFKRNRYDEISRRKSPTRENISKLNLFRNIYTENSDFEHDFKTLNNNNSEAKFFRINDLVSIMINDDTPNNINRSLAINIPGMSNKEIIDDMQLTKEDFIKQKKNYLESNLKINNKNKKAKESSTKSSIKRKKEKKKMNHNFSDTSIKIDYLYY